MKFLLLNKSQGYILATIMALAFLGSCYFFIYLPSNEKRVQQQRFRTLQNIDRNIHDKINNSGALLGNLMNDYKQSNKERINNYISKYPADKFSISPVNQVRLSQIAGKDSLLVEVNNSTRQIIITLSKPSFEDTNAIPRLSIVYSFSQFVSGLFPSQVFDEYLVFNDGSIVYESFPSGIFKVKEDSLLFNKNGISGSYVHNITAGGKEYKLFLHNVSFDATHKWVVGGLLAKDNYQQEKTQLPKSLWIFIITVLIAILLVFPWIRLYQMGSKDRLTLSDGASSIVVTLLIVSVLFFSFLEYNTVVRKQNPTGSLDILGMQIQHAFESEVAKYYSVLSSFDSLNSIANSGSISDMLTVNENEGNVALKKIIKGLSDKSGNQIYQVFWLDSTGVDMTTWTSMQTLPPAKKSLIERNYVKNIIDGRAYHLGGKAEQPFMLDQIISRTSGSFATVISKPSVVPGAAVVAMSCNMQTLQNIIMPAGFSFIIIDKDARVLYHSISTRNLNENVKAEFSDTTELINLINKRSSGSFNTKYFSNHYKVNFLPLPNVPYHLLVLSDTAFIESRDAETYSFTFFMMLLFFLYMLLQITITLLGASRRSFFKNQSFDTSWIGPKKTFHKDYLLVSAINIILIAILLVFSTISSLMEYMFLLSITVSYIIIFLNLLFYKRYKDDGNTQNLMYKRSAIKISLCILLLQNISVAIILKSSFFIGLLIQAILIFSGWLLFKYAYKLPLFIRELLLTSRIKYYHSFSFMALTCLIITSGLPVAYFFESSFDFEKKIVTRYRQIDFANKLLQNKSFNNTGAGFNEKYGYDTTGVYFDSIYISQLPKLVNSRNIITGHKLIPIDYTDELILSAFHLPAEESYTQGDYYVKEGSTDSTVVFKEAKVQDRYSHYTFVKTNMNGQYLAMHSNDVGYEIPAPGKGKNVWLVIIYWLFFFMALVGLYKIIVNVVKKLFCLNIPNLKCFEELDNSLITDDKLNKLLLIIGLPGAYKMKYILQKIEDKTIRWKGLPLTYNAATPDQNDVIILDMINLPDSKDHTDRIEQWNKLKAKVMDGKYKLAIINHFEYNIQDAAINLEKLRLLEALMLKGVIKIFILSTIHPMAYLDSLLNKSYQNSAINSSVQNIERWQLLLGHYRIATLPISELDNAGIEYDPKWLQSFCDETNYTHYLQHLQSATLNIARKFDDNALAEKVDLMVYKVQMVSEYFYMYIWQSLTEEEKFILYDLAEDNLVNSYDKSTLNMLIAKGVIIQSNGLLRIFNKGFRNFILTAIGHRELNKIKEKINENGNWHNLKVPLVMIIFSILAFLLISEQEVFTKLLTYVAALTAGVPAVLKIFSLFDRSSNKPAS